MSHFSVVVIGDNYEKQLAPYHEYECTGVNDQYVVEVDRTEEVRAKMREVLEELYEVEDEAEALAYALDWFGCMPVVGSEEQIKRDSTHQWGYALVRDAEPADGDAVAVAVKGKELVRAVRRTNPNAKWDWYAVGGRWHGYFKLKPGAVGRLGEPGVFDNKPRDDTWTDCCRKRDIDIDAMRDIKALEAGEQWEKVHAVIDKHPPIKPWAQVFKEVTGHALDTPNVPEEALEQAREAYRNQPGNLALSAATIYLWNGAEQFQCSKQELMQRARNRALAPYAIVKDSKWYQKGDMGWWGISSNEISEEEEWIAKVNELFESVSDDTVLTAVDCHI